MHPRITLALLALAALLPAQRRAVLPSQYEAVWSTAASTSSGLGATKQGITQMLFPSPFAAPTSLVFAVGFHRACNTTDYGSFSADVEILAESTALTYAAMSTTFAANLGPKVQVLFPRKVVNVPALTAMSPFDSWIDFPAATPVSFAGPNLMLQMKVFDKPVVGTGSAFKMERNYKYAANGEARAYGTGCGAAAIATASTGKYMYGSSFDLTLTKGPAGSAALALVAADIRELVPGVKLPLDLTPLGLTGCSLMVPPHFPVATVTDSSGQALLTFPLPNDPSAANAGFGLQWLYYDVMAPNPAKLLLTNAVALRIGPILPTNSYLWDLSDVNAVTGTLMEGGPIMGVLVAP